MDAEQFKWPDAQPSPGEVFSNVRVVIHERKPGGHRYCFTNFTRDVQLDQLRNFLYLRQLTSRIDLDDLQTEVIVETRAHTFTGTVPWVLHATLKSHVVGDEPPGPVCYPAPGNNYTPNGTDPKNQVPVTDGIDGPVIGRTENTHTDDAGTVTANFFVDPNKMLAIALKSTVDTFVFNYPAGNDSARLNAEINAMKVVGKPATVCPRDPHTDFPAVECLPPGALTNSVNSSIPNGPAKGIRLLCADAQWSTEQRAVFMAKVKLLANAIDRGELTFDPFVMSLICAGIAHKMKEFCW